MRPIDADAMLSFVDVGHLRNPRELCFSEMDVKNIIDKQPTISPAANWTPCSVALPEVDSSYDFPRSDNVWVTVENGTFRFAAEAFFDYRNHVWKGCYDDAGALLNVIAWSPKPEPYRGEVE